MSTMDTSFPQFKRFPSEVQDIIWSFTMANESNRFFELLHGGNVRILDGATIPAILHACHRSRTLALGRWKLICFQRDSPGAHRQLFFDLSTDAIYLPHAVEQGAPWDIEEGETLRWVSDLQKSIGDDIGMIQNLAIPISIVFADFARVWPSKDLDFTTTKSLLSRLKWLAIIVDDARQSEFAPREAKHLYKHFWFYKQKFCQGSEEMQMEIGSFDKQPFKFELSTHLAALAPLEL